MKIYASDLEDITQVLTGNILEIKDAHTIAGVDISGANKANGLIIAGGDVDKFVSGTGQELSITNASIGRLPVAVLSTNGSKGAVANSGTTTSGGGFIDSSILQDTSGHIIIRSGASTPANLTVTGDLIVEGDSSVLVTAETITEDPYIAVNVAIDSDGNPLATSTSADGGLLVQRETATAQPSAGSGTTGAYAGIRFDESAGQWQTTIGTTASGGADGDWVNIGSGSGTVDKYAETCSLAAGGTLIFITPDGGGTDEGGATPKHSLAGSDFSVKTFIEDGVAYEEVIPENVYNIHTDGTFEGATRTSGTVAIRFPVLSTGSVTNIRVIIKG